MLILYNKNIMQEGPSYYSLSQGPSVLILHGLKHEGFILYTHNLQLFFGQLHDLGSCGSEGVFSTVVRDTVNPQQLDIRHVIFSSSVSMLLYFLHSTKLTFLLYSHNVRSSKEHIPIASKKCTTFEQRLAVK